MRFLPFVLLAALVHAAAPAAVSPQAPAEAALRRARDAQRRFELERIRLSPENPDPGSGSCDEVVGRLCLHDGEGGDWYPFPENPRISGARDSLLAALDEAAGAAPDDAWIQGQRVFYEGEAGRWERADSIAAAACEQADARAEPASGSERGSELGGAAWCRSLEGLALHQLGRFGDAERAFRSAIARMDSTRARRWSDPEPWLDEAGRGWWRRLPAAARPEHASLLWTLADPLLVVPGNDALTETWARRTVVEIRSEARNGYGMNWGSDLEELVLRFGWEIGWERLRPRPLVGGPPVTIGHHHPEGRPLFPPSRVLSDPAGSTEEEWIPGVRLPRSGYAPVYAPTLLPGAGQLAIFPRADRFVVVGTFALPLDTTYHAGHNHTYRKAVHPLWSGRSSEGGLFLIPMSDTAGSPADSQILSSYAEGKDQGVVVVEAPAGRWIASLEVFNPTERRAGRTRTGLVYAPNPPDLPTLSDLLLVDRAQPDGATLEETAMYARPTDWLYAGERLAVAWEVFGLRGRAESLSYQLSVTKAEGGALVRAIRRLGLIGEAGRDRLEWAEVAPDGARAVVRSIEIELPSLEPGRYVVRLEIGLPGRTSLVKEKVVEIRPPG